MRLGKFTYTKLAPPRRYRCSRCNVHGVKLWRSMTMCADDVLLLCAFCCRPEVIVDEGGKHDGDIMPGHRTDQFFIAKHGTMLPAVPTEDGLTFWGYTSIPQPGVHWWRALPTRGCA